MSGESLQKSIRELNAKIDDQADRLDRLEHLFERATGVSIREEKRHDDQGQSNQSPKKSIWGVSRSQKAKDEGPKLSWEERLGQNILPKLGVITILIGVSLFLKYSFDQGWITPWGQIIMGLIGGLAFLGLGEYFVKKYANWAHVMTGGGLAILYFSLFAGRFFYDLIPVSAAFVSMIVVTVMAGYAAVRYDARWIAYLALIGGYATPVLIQSSSFDPVVLMGYGFTLAFGVVVISLFKKWPFLTIAAQILTAIYAAWSVDAFALRGGLLTVALFLLIFSGASFYRYGLRRQPVEAKGGLETVLPGLFSGLLLWIVFFTPFSQAGLAEAIGGLALYYAGLAGLAFWRAGGKNRHFAQTLSGVAVVAAVIFTVLKFEADQFTLSLLILFTLVMSAGLGLKEAVLRQMANLVGLLALMAWWQNISDTNLEEIPLLVNNLVALAVVIIGLSILVVWAHLKWPDRLGQSKSEVMKQIAAYTMVAVAVAWLIITHQIHHGFELEKQTVLQDWSQRAQIEQLKQVMVSAFWTLYALSLVVVGFWKRQKLFRWLGLGLFAFTGLKVFLIDTSNLDALYRIVVFIGLGGIAIAASYLYQRYKERLLPQ